MWECIYNDCFKKKLLDGYEGLEKDLIRIALFLYGILTIWLVALNLHTQEIKYIKTPMSCVFGFCVAFVLIVIAVDLSMKRKSKRSYRIAELKKLKEILENETYQLCTIEEKKKFLDYIEKEREQLSQSFFNKNASVTIVSGTIIFFTATMDTFSKFIDEFETFLLRWVVCVAITVFLLSIYLLFRREKEPTLVRCEKICNLTKEIILFDKSLEQEEEPVRYTIHTDNLILFLKRIMQNLLEKVKQIYSCRKGMK